MVRAHLTAVGWLEPQPIATLLIAAAAEVALHELHAGAALPALRRAALAVATHDPSAGFAR